MSIVKVIEVLCEGKTIEEALSSGVQEAAKTIKHIKQIDVKWVHGHVENNKITSYRVNAKISFVIKHE
ncbi:MAG TPA: dodecin domain-containing protein [Parachlamydiales bacterium]|nr:dodecin domain-containing protein [Parachlamydiales bacterium]